MMLVRHTSHGYGRAGNRRASYITGVVISAYLVIWLALFPVFQAAHLAFASHAHFFCHEHLRIEDVPRSETGAGQAERRLDLDSHFPSILAARTQTTPPDLLLNFSLSRDPVLSTSRPVATPLADMIPTSMPVEVGGSAPQPVLLLAPKTSPPSVASS